MCSNNLVSYEKSCYNALKIGLTIGLSQALTNVSHQSREDLFYMCLITYS